MTLKQLLKQFLYGRGGLIALAALLAIILRSALPITTRDYIICAAIVLGWPIYEYIAHKYLMHEWIWTPFRFTHDRHHHDPTPETGLPDLWVINVYFINSLIFLALPVGIYTAHTTILCMLLWYEFAHYSCHTPYQPKTWWGYAIRVNHLQHHKLNSPDRYSLLFPIIRKAK